MRERKPIIYGALNASSLYKFIIDFWLGIISIVSGSNEFVSISDVSVIMFKLYHFQKFEMIFKFKATISTFTADICSQRIFLCSK